MEKNEDRTFATTLVYLGFQSSAKDFFVGMYVRGKRANRPDNISGMEILLTKKRINSKDRLLTLINTDGQLKFNKYRESIYPYVSGVVIIFEKNKLDTFNAVERLYYHFSKHSREDNIPVLLLGIKSEDEIITKEEGKILARKLGILYTEVDDFDVQEFNQKMVELINKIFQLRKKIPSKWEIERREQINFFLRGDGRKITKEKLLENWEINICLVGHPRNLVLEILHHLTDERDEKDVFRKQITLNNNESMNLCFYLTDILETSRLKRLKFYTRSHLALLLFNKIEGNALEEILKERFALYALIAIIDPQNDLSIMEGKTLAETLNLPFYQLDENKKDDFVKIIQECVSHMLKRSRFKQNQK